MPGTPLTSEQQRFRTAMADLSAAVGIVTTDGPRGRAGLTVSALCSVTDSPPTVLVCVNRAGYTHDFFGDDARACLNVLGPGHRELALAFAGRGDVPMVERLADPLWDNDSHDVPVLRGAPVSLIGRVTHRVPQGSHTVLFLRGETILQGCERVALVYYQRRFHTLPDEVGCAT